MKKSLEVKHSGNFTRVFKKKLKKMDKPIRKRIKDLVDKILKNPTHNTPFLKGPKLRGKRKGRAGSYRVSFAICGECRELGHTKFNDCYECEKHKDEEIIFFDCGHRDKFYD